MLIKGKKGRVYCGRNSAEQVEGSCYGEICVGEGGELWFTSRVGRGGEAKCWNGVMGGRG